MSKTRRVNHRPKHKSQPSHRPLWRHPVVIVGVVGALLMAIIPWVFQIIQQKPYTPEVSGGPSIVVEPTDEIDFGDVKLNSTVEATFKVRNVGDEMLVILGEPQVEVLQGC